MPYCSVLECKNDSRTKNVSNGGISYHRFPKDPHRKEKWMVATGRQNWFPSKNSTICSDHFVEVDYLTKSGKKYLADTAVPKQKILNFQSDAPPNFVQGYTLVYVGAEPRSEVSLPAMQHDLKTNDGEIHILNVFSADSSVTSSGENEVTCEKSEANDPLTLDEPATSDSVSYQDTLLKEFNEEDLSTQQSTTENEHTTCLFCCTKHLGIGRRRIQLVYPKTKTIITQLKKIATTLKKTDMLHKIENESIAYHPTCLKKYHMQMNCGTEDQDSNILKKQDIHSLALKSIAEYIQQEIINNHKVMYFSQLLSRYKALLLELSDNTYHDHDTYRTTNLEKEVEKIYGDCIIIKECEINKKKIIYFNDTNGNEDIELGEIEDSRYQDVAYDLRQCVNRMANVKPAPNDLKNDFEIPEQLFEFMYHLIGGPNVSSEDSNMTVKVESICSDVINMIKNGRVKIENNEEQE